ncbi:MAG: DUF2791 family P-loop domain-containing protein [Actinomycetota bacterium]|nr:DUF2791 family P-loop domain-containing protein [Actinomycetota bacterium]
MTDVALRLLGQVELVVDGTAVPLGGVRQRAIVALLALHRDRAVATNAIVDQVWGNDAPRTVLKSLSTMLSRVRPVLEPHGIEILNSGAGYQLHAPEGCVDLHAFRDAVSRARVAELGDDRATAIAELQAALACWVRPVPLVDIDGPFVEPTQAALAIERDAVTSDLARLHRLAGDPTRAVHLLRHLAEQAPTREDRQVELMRALTAVGRVDEAIAVYDETARRLADEVGIEPGAILRAARRDAVTPAAAHHVPIVGRERELEALEASLRAALQRDTRVVAITGEPGAGKSHLVEAFVGRVTERGFLAFVCRCEPTGTVPLHSLLQIFKQTTNRGMLDERDYPNLRDLLEHREADPAGDSGDLRRRLLLQEIMEIVLVLAAQGPLIVVIEDFHNADPMTLSVIEATSYEGIELPSILVLTARESELLRGGPAELALAEVAARGRVERIELEPLDREAIATLVKHEQPDVASDPVRMEIVHEGAGGNPLYARLLAGHLADHDDPEAPLPADVVALVRQRVLDVPERGRELLIAASVLGRDFTLNEAAALLDDDERLRQLRTFEARRSGLLEVVEGGARHRFTHGIVQRVTYELADPEHRAALHLGAARVRQDTSIGDLETVHHLLNARPLVSDHEVVERILDAARRTIGHGVNASAVKLLGALADLELQPLQQATALVLRGVALVADGAVAAAAELDRGIAEAQVLGAWEVVAEGLLARARVGRLPTFDEGQAHAAQLIAAIDSGHLDERRVGYLLVKLGEVLMPIDLEGAAAAMARADAVATRTGDDALARRVERIRVLELGARAFPAARCHDAAAALLERCLAVDDVTTASLTTVHLQNYRLRAGDLRGLAADADRFLALAADAGRHEVIHQLRAQRVAHTLATEPLAQAQQAVDALSAIDRGVAPTMAIAAGVLQRWTLRRERQTLAEYEHVLRGYIATGVRRPGLAALLVGCLVEQGRLDEARELLQPLPARLLSEPKDWALLSNLALLVDLAVDLHVVLPVDELRPILQAVAGDVVVLGGWILVLGRTERYLGRLEWSAGSFDEAVGHLERARTLDRESGFGLWSAWAARDEAVVRRLRGGPGDEDLAVELLDGALRTARRLGSIRLTRAVQEQF